MVRYYFHLRDGMDVALDDEGQEMADVEAAKAAALVAARDSLSHDIKAGVVDLRLRIDVEDGAGALIHSLPFREAFEVIDPA
jgi:hypothetical protein